MINGESPHRPESRELSEFRREVRAWITDNKPPEPDFVLPQSFLEVETRQQMEYLREWQHKLYDAGYLGFWAPQEYGGQGVAALREGIVSQEMSRARAPFMVNLIALQWAGPTILKYGTEQQKKKLIKPLLSAEEVWCQGFSEPGAGSDLASLATRAERDGTDWVVTGHKVWTTLAHFAQRMILLARTQPEGNKYAGLSYFVFPMAGEGITIEPLVKMTGEGGFNQVIFDHARAPGDALLGREGEGWKIAMTTLKFERGAADTSNRDRAAQYTSLLKRLVERAKTTMRNGRPATDDPVLRDRLAQLWTKAEAIQLAVRRARVPGLCSDYPMALPMMHKLEYSEFNQRLYALACDLLGPQSQLWMDDVDAPDAGEWPRGYMNSYGFTVGGGTSEIQRNILGERVLGLPKSR